MKKLEEGTLSYHVSNAAKADATGTPERTKYHLNLAKQKLWGIPVKDAEKNKKHFAKYAELAKKHNVWGKTNEEVITEAKYAWETYPWDVIDTHHPEFKVVKNCTSYVKAKILADRLNDQHVKDNSGSMAVDQGVIIPRYGVQLAVVKESLVDSMMDLIVEELSGSARIRLKANMKRRSAILTKRRAISSKKSASSSVINHRAEKKAHDLIMNKRVLHGRDKTKMSPAEKARIESKMRAYEPAVKKLAKKMFSRVKAAGELRRHSAMTAKKP